MQQSYRRILMPKCDFNKFVLQLYWNHTSHGCSPANLLHIFRIPFPKSTSGWLLLLIPLRKPLPWVSWIINSALLCIFLKVYFIKIMKPSLQNNWIWAIGTLSKWLNLICNLRFYVNEHFIIPALHLYFDRALLISFLKYYE